MSGSTNPNQSSKKIIRNKPSETDSQPGEKKTQKPMSELQAYRFELELLKEELRKTKENLEDTSRKFTELYDFAPSGYCVISKNSEIVELNLPAANMLNQERSVLANCKFSSFISSDTKSIFNLFLKEIFENKTRQTCEVVLSSDDHHSLYVIITGIITGNGEHCKINLIDISEKRQVEEVLKKSGENNRALILQTSMDGFWLVDRNGKILEVNENYCQMSGYSKEELTHMNISDLEALETDEDVANHIEKVSAKGEDHFDTRHRRKDGSLFDVEINLQYQHDNEGRFVVFLHDITRRKRIKEELLESEQRYHSIFESSNDAIFLVDLTSGRYIDCNHMAEKLTGYARSEIFEMKTGSFLSPKRKAELASNIELILEGKLLRSETEIISKSGKIIHVEFNSSLVIINKKRCILSMVHDISKRKAAEDALKQSEERIRFKLQSILSPEGSIANLDLADIIDSHAIQNLMDHFFELANVPMAILDIYGTVLVGVGWQDICTKFHRVNPDSCKNCIESDVQLIRGIREGEFKLYKCKNNMWDMATPLIIGGEHKGNLYLGQFFIEDEPIEYDLFRQQADKFNYTQQDYLDALEKVPRLSKQKLEHAKSFFLILARSISQLSYSNIKLSRSITQHREVQNKLREKESLLNKAQEIAHLGSWSLDLSKNLLIWSDELYRIFDLSPQEFTATYEGFLELVHPDDRDAVNSAYTKSVQDGKDGFEIEHRIIGRLSGKIRHVLERCEHLKDTSGKIFRSVGMTLDITERKQRAEVLREKEKLFRESQSAAKIGSYSIDLVRKTWKGTKAIYEIFGIDKFFPHTTEGWVSCVHPDFRNKFIQDFFNEQSMNRNFEHEYKIVRKNNGAERWIYVLGKFEYDNQKLPVRLIGTIQDITKRKEAEESLKQLNEELENRVKERTEELLNITVQIEERERNRFSRELHDDLGPILSAVKLYFQWLSETENAGKKKIISEKGNISIDRAIQTTREISHGLSSQILNNLGFVGAVQHFLQSINEMQEINIEFKFNTEIRFSNFLEITLYRITTELINNTIKYAAATRIEIIFNYSTDENIIMFTYADNGKGFDLTNLDKHPKGLGIMNIQRRINVLKGNIDIDTKSGKGVNVQIELPVTDEINPG